MNKANQISTTSNLLIHALFLILVTFCLLPVFLIIAVSFSEEASILKYGYRFIPNKFSLNAYSFLISDFIKIVRAYGVTIYVTVVGSLISIILTAFYAYPLYRKDFPFKTFFSMFIFITMIFDGGLVPFYILYTQYYHLNNSLVALILPYLINPFFVIIMRTFFTTTIPDALIDSAKIDGAKEFLIFYKIVFPISLPVFATIGLFSTLVYWNDWFMSLLFISDSTKISIQYYMYKVIMNLQFLLENTNRPNSINRADLPGQTARMAMTIICIGPIIFAYPFFQKYFIKGLTVGAVKG